MRTLRRGDHTQKIKPDRVWAPEPFTPSHITTSHPHRAPNRLRRPQDHPIPVHPCHLYGLDAQ